MQVSKDIEPFRFTDQERHDTALREAIETVIFDTEDGQQFSGLHLNRDFSDKPAIVRRNAWMSSVLAPEQKYAGYQYAAANPEHPIVILDMPAHGYSSKLTKLQRKEILDTGDLGLIGAAQSESVVRKLGGVKELIETGDSLGARIAADAARKAGELGVRPLALIGFDMVGLERRKSIAVAKSFFITEWLQSKRLYKENPATQELEQAYEEGFKTELENAGFNGGFNMVDIFRRDPKLLSFVVYKSPLATDSGVEALEKLLAAEQQIVVSLVVGGMSAICRWHKIQPTAERLERVHDGRIQFDVWPEDAHGMGLAPQQPRMAAYVSARVKDI